MLTWALAFLILPFLLSTNLLVTVGFVVAERALYLSVAGSAIVVVWGWQKIKSKCQVWLLQVEATWLLILTFHSKDWSATCSTVLSPPSSSSSPSALQSAAWTGERRSPSSRQAFLFAPAMPRCGTILQRNGWTWTRQRWPWPATGRLWGLLPRMSKLWTTLATLKRPKEGRSMPSECSAEQPRLFIHDWASQRSIHSFSGQS